MVRDRQAAAAAIDAFLRALGLESSDTAGTGARVAAMFADELCSGQGVDTHQLVLDSVIPIDKPSLVAVRDIAVSTMCPHHLLPAFGRATVAFKARTKVIGLGAVASLVDAHARRLALQENIGEAIADDLQAVLEPEWVGCRLVLTHGCMVARGERAHGTSVETIAGRGTFDTSFLR
jgi:GTP cyclohydrolase I